MKKTECINQTGSTQEENVENPFNTILESVLRSGAHKLLLQALENEVAEYLGKHKQDIDATGHQMVVRNGYHNEREIVTGLGPINLKQPRIHDTSGKRQFSSNIVPKYMRRIASVDNLIPVLYLKGISTGDFATALESILGPQASGLSATNIVRLKQCWEEEYKDWNRRSLKNKHYVYFWVDGIYFNVRLDDERQCVLVIIGATAKGEKELVAIVDGYRESKQSWADVLFDLKHRGLEKWPELAIGDGALGFWAAIAEAAPCVRHQRCWVHKTKNIMDKVPKAIQEQAKSLIYEMYMAETRVDAFAAYDAFLEKYHAKYPKACECLSKDREELFTFYDFPAEQWIHLRTTNPIESTFATVRHRTKRTKGCGSRIATLTMVFKLVQEAQKTWKRLRGYSLIPLLIEGKKFKDGELVAA